MSKVLGRLNSRQGAEIRQRRGEDDEQYALAAGGGYEAVVFYEKVRIVLGKLDIRPCVQGQMWLTEG